MVAEFHRGHFTINPRRNSQFQLSISIPSQVVGDWVLDIGEDDDTNNRCAVRCFGGGTSIFVILIKIKIVKNTVTSMLGGIGIGIHTTEALSLLR